MVNSVHNLGWIRCCNTFWQGNFMVVIVGIVHFANLFLVKKNTFSLSGIDFHGFFDIFL
jgi:hypothetical protein